MNLESFPGHIIHPDRELYRVHRATHGPFFFAAAPEPGQGGRFDLPTGAGSGTCYLSTSTTGACLETFGRFRVVPSEIVAARRLTVAAPIVRLRLADLTDRRILGSYGIAGDLSAGTDYALSQRWAQNLWEAGFDGIFYAARHDPQFTERSVAVFGRQGDQSAEERKRFEYSTVPIPREVLDELVWQFGIGIVPALDMPPDIFMDE